MDIKNILANSATTEKATILADRYPYILEPKDAVKKQGSLLFST